jgi:Permuted papain-like amidase enzyme, YaeF/YiiX, C92 family
MKNKWLVPLVVMSGMTVMLSCSYYKTVRASFYYDKKPGDVLFQSLAPNPVANMIEGSTGSRYSHCGILCKDNDNWYVVEAIGPVKLTPYWSWINRGYGKQFDAYRLQDIAGREADFIAAAKIFLGKNYDHHYKMDDDEIYCSELVYKAYHTTFHDTIGKIQYLKDLNWKPYEKLIEQIENGPVPLERDMITPKSISESPKLVLVYNTLKE